MAHHAEIAGRFHAALKAGGSAAAALLTEDVAFRSLNVEIEGRDKVLERLSDREAGRVYREAEWSDMRATGEAMQVTLEMPESSSHSGNILLLRFRGDRIATIEQQLLLPMRAAPVTPLRLTDELKGLVNDALAMRHPMLLAYVDADGQPVLSFRGSTQVFTDTQLAVWVRNSGGGLLTAIARNPKVALMYRDEDKKATFQFQGRARVVGSESDCRKVYEASHKVEQDHDFARLGVALIIDLDRVEGYAGLSAAGQVGRVNMRRIEEVRGDPAC
jgi:hypothetical protein